MTLWIYYRWGKYAITPDPDEIPGRIEWFTAWHASQAEAVVEARQWLAARGCRVGQVVGG